MRDEERSRGVKERQGRTIRSISVAQSVGNDVSSDHAKFPGSMRMYRVVSCVILFVFGMTALVFRNISLQNARDERLLVEIQRSIMEMDEIAAKATKMEAHAQRLASIVKSQLISPLHQLDDGQLVSQQEKIKADVESIHVETMKNMQNMMQNMIESTRKEALEMMLTVADEIVQEQVLEDAHQNHYFEEPVVDPPAPTPTATPPPKPLPVKKPSPSKQPTKVTKPLAKPHAMDIFYTQRFWFVSLFSTSVIVFVISQCLDRRSSITRRRLQLQRFLQRIGLAFQQFMAFFVNIRLRLWSMWQWICDKKEQLSTAIYWSPTKGGYPTTPHGDEEEESVLFYPQTPNVDHDPVQFNFSDDDEEEVDPILPQRPSLRQSNYVNAQAYGDLLTPVPRARGYK
ncbi:hypothetical protein THRCLA_05969 [Thraustotheca clavata]|uniref:Transmembrane protein n=1 Tax=Thraustotheca clavata TaxID=74557 RepID=A0A1V9ZQX4_9STRA|nr:hypothetical protein THRCLA_05969 [Thraustotheca clavata]